MASYDQEDLEGVLDKSNGLCEYCGKQLAWGNYGNPGRRGAWEVDHKIPLAQGGPDAYSNWVAACYGCNRAKSDMSSRQFRATLRPACPPREHSPSAGEVIGGLAVVGILALLIGAAIKARRRPHGDNGPPPGW